MKFLENKVILDFIKGGKFRFFFSFKFKGIFPS